MSVFKRHKISLKQVLDFIPEALLSHLSVTTKVDYYSKVLHGKKMFYLLLFCIFDNEKLSQRTLEDTFNSSGFKALFGLGEEEKVRRSSISERLSKIDSNYFKEIHEQMYGRFSELYSKTEIEKHNLIRIDSTIVSRTFDSDFSYCRNHQRLRIDGSAADCFFDQLCDFQEVR